MDLQRAAGPLNGGSRDGVWRRRVAGLGTGVDGRGSRCGDAETGRFNARDLLTMYEFRDSDPNPRPEPDGLQAARNGAATLRWRTRERHRFVRTGVLMGFLMGTALAAAPGTSLAQGPRPWIYFCASHGKSITSDRPILKCDGEQRILNPDGSVDRFVAAPPTEDGRSEQDEREQQEAAEDSVRFQETLRSRNLLGRYPTEARFNEARSEALEGLRASIHEAEVRTGQLSADRKNLLNETEYYSAKTVPPKLRTALDSSDSALATQKLLLQDRQAELLRVSRLYDDDLARLKKLWPAK
jgi:hypothetical protein